MEVTQNLVWFEASYDELNKFLTNYGLIPTMQDACVSTFLTKSIIVVIYVDDILIGYEIDAKMLHLMDALYAAYAVNDLGYLYLVPLDANHTQLGSWLY